MNRFTSKEILKGYAMAASDLIERGHADIAVSLLTYEAEIGVDDLKDLGLPRYDYQSLSEALRDAGKPYDILSAHLEGRVRKDEKRART